MYTLTEVAQVALTQCLDVKESERLLIVSNPETEQEEIAKAFAKQASAMGAKVRFLLQPVKTQKDFAEDEVIGAIEESPNVMLSISTEKLGKDKARLASPLLAPNGRSYDHIFDYLLHGVKAMRAVWTPGITKDIFLRTVPVDYEVMRRSAALLASFLSSKYGPCSEP